MYEAYIHISKFYLKEIRLMSSFVIFVDGVGRPVSIEEYMQKIQAAIDEGVEAGISANGMAHDDFEDLFDQTNTIPEERKTRFSFKQSIITGVIGGLLIAAVVIARR